MQTDFFQASESPHGRGADSRNSRHARDEIRRGLGAGRDLELQTASVRPPILHPQGSARCDRVRDFPQHAAALSKSIGRRRAGAGLRQRFRFRSARAISTQRSDPADARTWFVAGEVRSPQAQAGSGRPVRSARKRALPKFPRASASSRRRVARPFATSSTFCNGARRAWKS